MSTNSSCLPTHTVLNDDIGGRHLYRLLTMVDPLSDACCPSAPLLADLRPVEGDDAEHELAALAKAIGHPTRVRILRMIAGASSAGCGDLVSQLPLAQSTVSQHLKILRAAGLVRGEVEGTRRSYCLDPRGMRRLRALVGAL